MVGTSNLGSWNGHWFLRTVNRKPSINGPFSMAMLTSPDGIWIGNIHRSNMIQWFPMKRYNVATFPSVFWAQILVIRAVGVDVDHGFGILFSHGMRMEFSGNQQVGHIPENCFMWKYLSKSINRSSYQSYTWLVVWNTFDFFHILGIIIPTD